MSANFGKSRILKTKTKKENFYCMPMRFWTAWFLKICSKTSLILTPSSMNKSTLIRSENTTAISFTISSNKNWNTQKLRFLASELVELISVLLRINLFFLVLIISILLWKSPSLRRPKVPRTRRTLIKLSPTTFNCRLKASQFMKKQSLISVLKRLLPHFNTRPSFPILVRNIRNKCFSPPKISRFSPSFTRLCSNYSKKRLRQKLHRNSAVPLNSSTLQNYKNRRLKRRPFLLNLTRSVKQARFLKKDS